MKTTRRTLLSGIALLVLPLSSSLYADSASWVGTTAGNWTDDRWSTPGASPGATSGTTSTDVATINNASNVGTITVDDYRNVGGIVFSDSGVKTLSGGTLVLSQGGGINAQAARSVTVSSAIVLAGNGGTHTFSGNGTGTDGNARRLNISGSVTAGEYATTLAFGTSGTPGFRTTRVTGAISDGVLGGSLSVVKNANAIAELVGANTYSGNTTVNAGGSLTLTDPGSLTFYIGASGVNNSVLGAGTATFNGTFNLDLTNASTTAGSNWTLVNLGTLNGATSFGSTFKIGNVGFTEAGNVWSNGLYSFDETTGVLTAIPEPSAYAMFFGGLSLVGVIFGRRRRA